MDALDIRILRTMGVQPYGKRPRSPDTLTARHLAKALKVSPETVRDRIARMERKGAIAGYGLVPNLRHLGLGASCHLLRFRDDRALQGLEERLVHAEGFLGVQTFLGGVACLAFAHRSPADHQRRLRTYQALAGDAAWTRFFDIEFPPAERGLTSLDWRILQALLGDARRPLPEVARELKVSARTVKRRWDRMAKEGAFFALPLVDPAKVPGLILFEFVFEFEPEARPAALEAVRKVLDAHLICTDGGLGTGACFGAGLYATAVGEVEALRRAAAQVPGVHTVQALVLASSEERIPWLEDAIEARIAAPSRPASAGKSLEARPA